MVLSARMSILGNKEAPDSVSPLDMPAARDRKPTLTTRALIEPERLERYATDLAKGGLSQGNGGSSSNLASMRW